MERWLRKFFYNENGAVSLYLIIITLAIFIFNAVLIDYARIHVAQKQTEQAMQAAARSTMSAYDTSVQDYGLFVFDSDQGEALKIFEEVFEQNLAVESGGDEDYLPFVDTKSENIQLDFEGKRMLINTDVMEHQVLEEMKYKAPIEFTLEILENFLFASDAMEEASAFVDIASEVEKDFDKREGSLDKVEEKLKEAKEKLEGMKSRIETKPQKEGQNYPEVQHLYDIIEFFGYRDQVDDYREKLEEKEQELEDEKAKDDPADEEIEKLEKRIEYYEDKIKDFDNDLSKFKKNARNLLNRLIDDAKEVSDLLDEAMKELEEAEKRNKEIKETIEKHKNNANENYRNSSDSATNDPTGGSTGGPAEEMSKQRQNLEDLVMEDEFFETLKGKVAEAQSKVDSNDSTTALLQRLEHFLDVVNNLETDNSSPGLINGMREDIIDTRIEALNAVNEALTFFTDNREEYEIKKENEKDEEDAEKALEEAEEDIFSEMQKLMEMAEKLEEDIAVYTELEEILKAFENFKIDEIPDIDELDDPADAAKEMMGIVDLIFKEMGDILVGARNEIYINEYVLTRFESKEPAGLKNIDDFMFKNREVEYIMYGQPTPGANYGAAILQLFALRFALNFISAFTVPQVYGAGFPLAIFFAALRQAFVWTINDMRNLLNIGGEGKSVPLMRNIPGAMNIELDYNQYLRLFMFINPNRENRMTRALAVIQQKESGVDFKEQSTYVNINAETSVRLWFLPQVADILGRANVIEGRVEGNRFYIEKEGAYSY